MVVRKILEATLVAGATTVTFTDSDIPNSLIRVYSTDADLMPSNISLSGTTITVTYEAQTSIKYIALEIVKAGLDIIDNLTSDDDAAALSAKQGKALKTLIDNIEVTGSLSDLDDVLITSLSDGDMLQYDSNSSKWINIPALDINDISGVDTETLSSGQVLTYDGSKWINSAPATGGLNYSESEQDTGLYWIDNKKIYQKTVDFGSLPNSTTKSVNHGISNLETVVDIKAVAYYEGLAYGELMPLVYGGHTFRVMVRSSQIEIQCPSDNWSDYGCYITILYTKSS